MAAYLPCLVRARTGYYQPGNCDWNWCDTRFREGFDRALDGGALDAPVHLPYGGVRAVAGMTPASPVVCGATFTVRP